MDETMLVLKNGVKLIEKDGQFGLVLDSDVQYAKDGQQAEVLRALVRQSRTPESLVALLCESNNAKNDNDVSLAIAGFILDFGEFLEA